VIKHAEEKLKKKGCDWILANDVSEGTGTFGGDANTIHLVSAGGVEGWPTLSKQDVAQRLARRIADHLRAAHV
jgi:phosphopantothenoylcysteine decarboxylase/phosphopantothenate--cysteine ligase